MQSYEFFLKSAATAAGGQRVPEYALDMLCPTPIVFPMGRTNPLTAE